jgi:hypothetical protein
VLSRQRRQLHQRIEYARGTGAHEPGAAQLIAGLIEEEAEVSRRRRELHREIDRLRKQQ